MSPAEALNLIDQVSAKYQGTRADHEMLNEAIDVFRKLATIAEAPNRAARRKAARPKKKTPKTG